MTHQTTLDLVATFAFVEDQLLLSFDAFGDYRQVKAVRFVSRRGVNTGV